MIIAGDDALSSCRQPSSTFNCWAYTAPLKPVSYKYSRFYGAYKCPFTALGQLGLFEILFPIVIIEYSLLIHEYGGRRDALVLFSRIKSRVKLTRREELTEALFLK